MSNIDKDDGETTLKLEDILTLKEFNQVIEKCTKGKTVGNPCWGSIESRVRPAADGLAGFMGDHMRVELMMRGDRGEKEVIRLFIKCMPLVNKAKAEFINNNGFFRREMVLFQMFEHMGGADGPNPWHPKAYLCNDRVLVMPDLSAEGYITLDKTQPLNLDHVLMTLTSIARFHAGCTNYETEKSVEKSASYTISREHGALFDEPSFYDSPWLRAGAKLTSEFLAAFSTKYRTTDERAILKTYVETCDSFKEYDGTLNVAIHKDLWSSNIMFRYEKGKESPTEALLLDYQCVRYGPPAFDIMSFLYLNTTRRSRHENEPELFRRYFQIFSDNLTELSKERLRSYGYDLNDFLCWCERARRYGCLIALMIFPYVLMDSDEAKKHFDNTDTFDKYNNDDRSEPVLGHARLNHTYRDRLLDIFEEFLEKYVPL